VPAGKQTMVIPLAANTSNIKPTADASNFSILAIATATILIIPICQRIFLCKPEVCF
jgi:hypothetical protein